jgi:hypothetical protein
VDVKSRVTRRKDIRGSNDSGSSSTSIAEEGWVDSSEELPGFEEIIWFKGDGWAGELGRKRLAGEGLLSADSAERRLRLEDGEMRR